MMENCYHHSMLGSLEKGEYMSGNRCAVDAWAQQDVRRGDVVAWPTNLGWMMGPFLLYASLLNGAAMALFQASLCVHPV